MAKFSPLPFQKEIIDELKETFVRLWVNPERQLPLVLKSPTGSGKTFTSASFINELNGLPNWDADKAFIWITFSDDLAMQSKDKFHDYFKNALKNDLLTVNDINNGKLKKCRFRRKLPPIPEITLPLNTPSNSLVDSNTKVAGLRQCFA